MTECFDIFSTRKVKLEHLLVLIKAEIYDLLLQKSHITREFQAQSKAFSQWRDTMSVHL